MIKKAIFLLLLVFITSVTTSFAASDENGLRLIKVKPDREFELAPEEHNYAFSVADSKYLISNKGIVQWENQKGMLKNFKLYEYETGSDAGMYITKLFYTQFKDNLVILFELDDMDYGAAKIVMIKKGFSELMWIGHIPGFNLCNGLIEQNFIYIAASGFIGKLDLESGKYLWSYDDLYNKYKANIFVNIEISGDLAAFYYLKEPIYNAKSYVLKYSKVNGKLIGCSKVKKSE